MEKTIIIDGRSVRLKSTAGTPKRYKAQFGKDYFAELLKMARLLNVGGSEDSGELDLNNLEYSKLDYLDFEVLYNFIWALAKTADKTISDPLDWLDEFDAMPIAEIFPQVIDLLESSIGSKKK